MVAKTYQGYPTIGKPYNKGEFPESLCSDKLYIKVQTPSGKIKEVRYYYEPPTIDSVHIARFGSLDRQSIYLTPSISLQQGIDEHIIKYGARYRQDLGWYWFSLEDLNLFNPSLPYKEHTWRDELSLISKDNELKELIKNV